MKIFIAPHLKIGYFFLILTLVLFGGFIFTLFFTLRGVEIIVKPKIFNIETSFKLEIDDKIDRSKMNFFEETKETEKEFSPKTKTQIYDYAGGEVKIINTSNQEQTLVATTRLLSPQGLIFRINNTIHIKPKGETKTYAKADKTGKEYEIAPTKFTIPGLSTSLQKLIYAETEKPMTATSLQSGLVTLADLEEAKKKLKDQLYKNVLDEIKKGLPENNLQIITKSIILSEKSDTKINEEKEKFKVYLKLKVIAMTFPREDLLEIAKNKLQEQLKEDNKLVSYDKESLSCLIDKIDVNKKEGTLTIAIRGEATINEQSKIFEKEKMTNATPEKVKEYLQSSEEIEDVRIKFFPPFLKKMPRNPEKIKIVIR